MLQSNLFTKTTKHTPKDEISKNADLLLRGGFINKEMAGVYSLMPLGLKVQNKIESIIREEMEKLGGQEINLTALQEKDIWQKTGRWDSKDVDVWFKTKLQNKTELGLAFTHEEPLTSLLKNHISSYKDLPKYIFQFQTKFRNETRAKSGILRTREFVMKDLYSFHENEEDLNTFYEKAAKAYKTIFKRLGLGKQTFKTYASGGSFSKYSHEFQTETESGEDTIFVCQKCKVAINDEIKKEMPTCPECNSKEFNKVKTVEVGNIFKLGVKFSESLGLLYKDKDGKQNPVFMGSYGIGLGRALGTVVEVNHDTNGIIWPSEVAPFKAHIIAIGSDSELKKAKSLYEKMNKKGIEVLLDDRIDLSVGQRLAESDLYGVPHRFVIGSKNKGKIEYKLRSSKTSTLLTESEALKKVI